MKATDLKFEDKPMNELLQVMKKYHCVIPDEAIQPIYDELNRQLEEAYDDGLFNAFEHGV